MKKEEIKALAYEPIGRKTIRFYLGRFDRVKNLLNYEQVAIYKLVNEEERRWKLEIAAQVKGEIKFSKPYVSKINWTTEKLKPYYTIEEVIENDK